LEELKNKKQSEYQYLLKHKEEIENKKIFVDENFKNKAFEDAINVNKQKEEIDQKLLEEKNKYQKLALDRGNIALKEKINQIKEDIDKRDFLKLRQKTIKDLENNRARENAHEFRKYAENNTIISNTNIKKISPTKINCLDFNNTNFNCCVVNNNKEHENIVNNAYERANQLYNEKIVKQQEELTKKTLKKVDNIEKKCKKLKPYETVEIWDYTNYFDELDKQENINQQGTNQVVNNIEMELNNNKLFNDLKHENKRIKEVNNEYNIQYGSDVIKQKLINDMNNNSLDISEVNVNHNQSKINKKNNNKSKDNKQNNRNNNKKKLNDDHLKNTIKTVNNNSLESTKTYPEWARTNERSIDESVEKTFDTTLDQIRKNMNNNTIIDKFNDNNDRMEVNRNSLDFNKNKISTLSPIDEYINHDNYNDIQNDQNDQNDN